MLLRLVLLQIIEADVRDPKALLEVMRGHTHCICTAGNAKAPQEFESIFRGKYIV